jgi:hypothetical protein
MSLRCGPRPFARPKRFGGQHGTVWTTPSWLLRPNAPFGKYTPAVLWLRSQRPHFVPTSLCRTEARKADVQLWDASWLVRPNHILDTQSTWEERHSTADSRIFRLFHIYSLLEIMKSRGMRWAGHVERMGEKRSACKLLVGKPEGKATRKTKT